MSKKRIWILSISLSLVMLGLIIVQVKWIGNALVLKDKQFQQLVNSTLSEVSRQVDMYSMEKRVWTIMEKQQEELDKEEEVDLGVGVGVDEQPVILIGDNENNEHIFLDGEELDDKEFLKVIGDTMIIVTGGNGKKLDTIMIQHLGEDETYYTLRKSIRKQEQLVNDVLKKMLMEDVLFEERIDQKTLQKILDKNLNNRGIDIDYEYAVINKNEKHIYHSSDFSTKTDYYYYRTPLLHEKMTEEGNYLYIYFPDQKMLLRGSLGILGPLTISLIILLIVLVFFVLYVIFKQKRLSDVKNDFVSNMTHELKTPISTISLASQMLSDESIPSEQKNIGHISKIIATESKRLGYQVERVLQMSVLDQGHLVLKRTELSMRDVVEGVIHNFKIQVESRKGTLEVIEDSNDDIVYGDRVHLTNVVTNLLDNAVKYSNEVPEITVTLYNTSDCFGLRVKDRGIGISKENQKRIFDRFFRVSTGNVHDVKGFGLGLSYVKLIVEQHEGRINLSSELGKGTTFDVFLPIHTIEN